MKSRHNAEQVCASGHSFLPHIFRVFKKKKLLHAQITVASLDEELRQHLLKEISKTNHGVSLSDYYKFVFLVQRLYIDLYFS